MLANDGHGLGHVVKMELGLLGAWWDTGEPVTQARQAKKAQLFCFVLVLFHWPIFGWFALLAFNVD